MEHRAGRVLIPREEIAARTADLGRAAGRDIVDSGRTLGYLRRNFATRRPKSLSVCVLLDKIERREVDVKLDYVGFVIPDRFVVGYGFDFGGLHRSLPDIHVVEPPPP